MATPERIPRAPDDAPDLGLRLRARRKRLGLTLQAVAGRAGLTAGFISQVERGITAPSLSSLAAISQVLGIDMETVFQQPRGAESLTRKDTRPVYGFDPNSLKYERISSYFPGNLLRSVIIHEPPGHRSAPISHEGEELFFILSGSITVELDGVRTVLDAGDSIHFASSRTHSTWNHTAEPASILHVCTMDVFGDVPAHGIAGPPPGDPLPRTER